MLLKANEDNSYRRVGFYTLGISDGEVECFDKRILVSSVLPFERIGEQQIVTIV